MKRGSVLFVDDEPNVTAALRRAFAQQPYEIHTARSAQEALELLAQHNDIDVVISDERMPGIPGSVFLRQVKESWPDTVRIILSGQASLEDVARAVNEGEIYRFFIKPFNATELSASVRQGIEQKHLVRLSRMLLQKYRHQAAVVERQASYIEKVTQLSPGLMHLDVDEEGAILLNDDDADVDVGRLLDEIAQEIEFPPTAP
jgi:two-component system, probable response regulator PhcQ